jgi:hypothetical protein
MYRIQNKQNVHQNGRKTAFDAFEKQGNAFVFIGRFTATGFDASDEKCKASIPDEDEE